MGCTRTTQRRPFFFHIHKQDCLLTHPFWEQTLYWTWFINNISVQPVESPVSSIPVLYCVFLSPHWFAEKLIRADSGRLLFEVNIMWVLKLVWVWAMLPHAHLYAFLPIISFSYLQPERPTVLKYSELCRISFWKKLNQTKHSCGGLESP